MWVAKRRHDLDFSSNVNHVLFIFNLLLPDRLDGNLREERVLELQILFNLKSND